jgi:4-hydroxy-tetrahydrodipicolinate reductase
MSDTPPIRLLVHGASGRMGRALCRLAGDAGFVVVAGTSRGGEPVADGVPGLRADALDDAPPFDVAIDFSLPAAFDGIVALCLSRGCPLVSGTTGLSEAQRDALAAASAKIPVLWASNFSLGVAVMELLLRQAAPLLAGWSAAMVETHHVHKKDAPSGTAISLSEAWTEAGGAPAAIASQREGEVVGEHRLRLSGPGEWLEIAHGALDRDVYARGALAMAARLRGRRAGRYAIADLLGPAAATA